MSVSGLIISLSLLAALSLGLASAQAQTNQPGNRNAAQAEPKPRAKPADKRPDAGKKLSPEEREAKRAEIKTRLEKRLAELRSKETNSSLTAAEKEKLERCEQILKRFEAEASKPGAASEKLREKSLQKGHSCEKGQPGAA